jgi:septal ring factor EnvC (AmiA/AmiB activator)
MIEKLEKLEKHEKTVADTEAEKAKVEHEMREIQSKINSLEFAIKWFEP